MTKDEMDKAILAAMTAAGWSGDRVVSRSDHIAFLAGMLAASDLLSLTRAEASLIAGEMTAGEWRTVSAVLRQRQDEIRGKADAL